MSYDSSSAFHDSIVLINKCVRISGFLDSVVLINKYVHDIFSTEHLQPFHQAIILILSYQMVINKLSFKAHHCMYSLHNIKRVQMISAQGKGTQTKTRAPACPYI